MTIEVTFTVPGDPVPWARAGAKGALRFTPPRQRAFAKGIKILAKAAMRGREPITGPVELSVKAIYQWPQSWSAKKRAEPLARWKTSRPDEDNLKKIVQDALNEIVFVDDAQVCSGHCWKMYGDQAGLLIRVRPLE